MIIKFNSGRSYDITNPIVTFRGITIDLTNALNYELKLKPIEDDVEGELARLILEQMNHPAYINGKNLDGTDRIIPAKTDGIDMTTASDTQLRSYTKGSHFTQQLIRRLLSSKPNTLEYLGEVGFRNDWKKTKSDI